MGQDDIKASTKKLLVINLSEELYEVEYEGTNHLTRDVINEFLNQPETRKELAHTPRVFDFICKAVYGLGPVWESAMVQGLTHVDKVYWRRPNLILELSHHEPSE